MNSNETECRRAFNRFLEDLRLDVFSMSEGLRAVRTSADHDMDARMQRLGDVGATASQIHGKIEQLFAAVWFGFQDDVAPAPPVKVERREPVGVR